MKEQPEAAHGGEQIEFGLSNPQGPELSAIAGALADAFGGPRGLAAHAKSVYDSAPDGGNVRAQIMKTALSLFEEAAKQASDEEPATEYSYEEEQDLLLGIQDMLRKHSGLVRQIIGDAPITVEREEEKDAVQRRDEETPAGERTLESTRG